MLNPKLSKSKKLSKNRLTVQTPLHSLQYLQQQVCFISPWKKMDRRSEMPRSDRRHASTSPKILSASCEKHQLWSVRLINLNSIVTNSDMVLHKHVVVCLNYTIKIQDEYENHLGTWEYLFSVHYMSTSPTFIHWTFYMCHHC